MQNPGLYIHVPFCISRCAYCDFYSVTNTDLTARYVNALCREIELYKDTFNTFDTIYFGGGTPSVLTPAQLGTIIDKVHATFAVAPGTEITLEMNPADMSKDDLEALLSLGFNRLNIGVQSLDNTELKAINRRHNAEEAITTIENASQAGFENTGLDLIYQLPGQTINSWMHTLERATRLNPSHLSCYELEIKKGTPIAARFTSGEFTRPDEETQREFFIQTSQFLTENGYLHYEVSNFASSPDTRSKHNSKYWNHTPYLGLGPSAHSFKNNSRWWNTPSIEDYISKLEKNTLPPHEKETLDNDQLHTEAIFLGLRTSKGIDLEEHKSRYGHDLMKEKTPVIKKLQDTGLIVIKNGFLRPTLAGMAVADSIALL